MKNKGTQPFSIITKLAVIYRRLDNAQSTIYGPQDNAWWGPPLSGKKVWLRITGIVWFIVGAALIVIDDNPAGWGVVVLGLLYWLVVAFSLFSRKKEIKNPESMVEISASIGEDVRDLYVAGYTRDDIEGVLRAEYTLEQLLARGPSKRRE